MALFDTGASYSAGEAEPRLGRALKGLDVARLVIATKAGTYHAGGGRIDRDFAPAAIVASAEQSLKNLGLEQVDLVGVGGLWRDAIEAGDGPSARRESCRCRRAEPARRAGHDRELVTTLCHRRL